MLNNHNHKRNITAAELAEFQRESKKMRLNRMRLSRKRDRDDVSGDITTSTEENSKKHNKGNNYNAIEPRDYPSYMQIPYYETYKTSCAAPPFNNNKKDTTILNETITIPEKVIISPSIRSISEQPMQESLQKGNAILARLGLY